MTPQERVLAFVCEGLNTDVDTTRQHKKYSYLKNGMTYFFNEGAMIIVYDHVYFTVYFDTEEVDGVWSSEGIPVLTMFYSHTQAVLSRKPVIGSHSLASYFEKMVSHVSNNIRSASMVLSPALKSVTDWRVGAVEELTRIGFKMQPSSSTRAVFYEKDDERVVLRREGAVHISSKPHADNKMRVINPDDFGSLIARLDKTQTCSSYAGMCVTTR